MSVNLPSNDKPVTSYTSWGRRPLAIHRGVFKPTWANELGRFDDADAPVLAYGLGRSYGDSCLNDGGYLIDVSGMDHFLAFDHERGVVRCAAGVSLASILEVAVPRGWFLPVTPGTKFVTIAGAIANDVHGKNHHFAGTIGKHVTQFELQRSDGTRVLCSPERNIEYYAATIGGLGLTGIILWAELQLQKIVSSKVDVETLAFHGLKEFLDITADSEQRGFVYTVAWIDCLSGKNVRGIFIRGNHALAPETLAAGTARGGPRVPFSFPELLLNKYSIKLFNSAYFRANRRKRGIHQTHYEPFFYPLDSVRDWNLIYGKRGFTQYQCVVPSAEHAAFEEILGAISDSGEGSFLGVIKQFGDVRSPGMLSFPRPGLTLALDFAYRGNRTLRLFERLDDIVYTARGALYPAKDSRMSRKMFETSYPRLGEFKALVDPHISSTFWRRVQESA